jgi:hypothetical protein
MTQYKIETIFTTQGGRIYYVEAESADAAVKQFNKEVVKNNQAEERIYCMTEDIKNVETIAKGEEVDVKAFDEARKVEWEHTMNNILASTRKRLKSTMGFGVPDEVQELKS